MDTGLLIARLVFRRSHTRRPRDDSVSASPWNHSKAESLHGRDRRPRRMR